MPYMETFKQKLARMVEEARDFQHQTAENLGTSENPELLRMSMIHAAKASALEDVLAAVNGQFILLKILGGK